MKIKELLLNKIETYIKVKESDVIYGEISVEHFTFMALRDRLIGNGTILEEDFDNQIYVIRIMSGTVNMNPAVIAVKLDDEKIKFSCYACEGFIKQRTAEKAIDKLKTIVK